MAITKEQLDVVIKSIEDKEQNLFFYAEDSIQPDETVMFAYKHVAELIKLGYNATIVHQEEGFKPDWVEEYVNPEDIPVQYFSTGQFDIKLEDFFFVPEHATKLMENLGKAPCKNVVVVNNWFKVLAVLEPGNYWDTFKINTAISLGEETTEYVRTVMPFVNAATVSPSIDTDVFTKPEKMTDKKMIVAFSASRDGGNKSASALKNFYALYPYLRFIQFIDVSKLDKVFRADIMKDATWFATFDEFNTFPQLTLEAIACGCQIIGWDGMNSTNVINPKTAVVIPNGDVFRAGIAIGSIIEEFILSNTPVERAKSAEDVLKQYTQDAALKKNEELYTEMMRLRIAELAELRDRVAKKEVEEDAN